MSNYDFELDIYSDNPNADIIRRIRPGSEVLEFGPAHGRMTKYLCQELKCSVDIVELDPESGADAAQYARYTCLGPEDGNIETGIWKKKFSQKQYDAIVFTDVLEHLHNPKQALKDCLFFLKDDGAILCSVPNVAHSSIILGLLQGHFRYTDTGLLDRTHVHFFTEESFTEMITECGYYIAYEHAIVVPVGANELPFTYDGVCKDVENSLRQRPNGETYEYIFELRKKIPGQLEESVIVSKPAQSRQSVCYIKEENESDFCEQKKLCQAVAPGKIDSTFSLTEFPRARAIRIELLDCNALIYIDRISAVSNGAEDEITQFDTPGIRVGNKLLCFFDSIPDLYLWLDADKQYSAIRFQYEILVYHSDILTMLGKELCMPVIRQKNEADFTLKQLAEQKIQQDHLLQKKDEETAKISFQFKELSAEYENSCSQLLLIKQEHSNLSEKYAQLLSQENSLNQQLQIMEQEKQTLSRDLASMLSQKDSLMQQLQIVEQEKLQFTQQISSLTAGNDALNSQLLQMINSYSWKLSAPLRFTDRCLKKMCSGFKSIHTLWNNTVFYYKHYGLKASLYRARHYKKIKAWEAQRQQEICEEAKKVEIWEQLSQWIDTTPHEFIDIFPVPMGWNTPLFQRFQHLSLQAGNAGGISLYGAHPAVDKDVETYKFVTPTLCIVNLENPEVTEKFWNVLDQKAGLKFLRIQSIDLATDINKVENFLHRGYQIVYEYIDELTPQITGNIPEFVYQRHEYLLRNENITVVATSDKLFNQVKPYRSNNMVMLNNGVDYDHWHLNREETECPTDIKEIICQNKIVIGYHGALAQWIDYDLLKRIAADSRFILLLIGFEHDGNLKKSGILEKQNVYYIGPRSYQELNRYAIFYDIAILPFVINNITLSVSPVKIFEYMAAGKPVVTYALPECQKYKSCLCAKTQDEFMDQLEKAILLRNDAEYQNQLQNDALDNTWAAITKKMVEHVKSGYTKSLERRNALHILNRQLDSGYKDNCLEEILHLPKYQDQDDYCELTQIPYHRLPGDCKIIAYYLTQFHPDPHNEEWWGKGVTEWNNVSRAVPQFQGHYQPRLPGELGFYDLRLAENMKRQIELAKMYGVYGFSFYYYWFNGERLLEKPLEMFLSNPELDFPFSLCWANENWTKRFDGTDLDILMEQPKSVESYKNVISDIARFLQDPRYIEINGKKMLTIYRPSLMPEVKTVLNHWRSYCHEHGIGDLYLIAVKENMIDIDWLKEGYDAVSEFHPGTLYTNCLNITSNLKFLRKDFGGEVFSYPDIVYKQKYFRYDLPKLYRAVMPMWDNTARRDNKGMIFHGSTPALYKRWLKDVIQAGNARQDLEENIIFINAWNEWGEGAYLEPDKRYGYAYLEATKEAIEESR